jgi:hypothetical protein
MGAVLSAAAVRHYETEGYYLPVDALAPKVARDAGARVMALASAPPGGIKHPWHIKAHLLFDWVYGLATQPGVLDAVESVLGPDILLQSADLFVKPSRSDKIINWHQDANYWGFEPFDICTAWIALTDATVANGCMRFLPGSHRRNKLDHVETFAADSILSRGQEIVLAIDEAETVADELRPGQVSLHHCLLAHASGPNRTDDFRIGLAVRYMPAHVRQTEGPPVSAILVRGEDRYGHFIADDPPAGHLDPAAIAMHDRAMAPHAAENYTTT